ncbi:hypothetical protein Xbud_03829 [Xenorhabdus budapestensis]|uniref:Uncharacterized protein n=1 Tax=Xenorhabdus budapestensis TaxID=290110 RepID=A0A2D0IJP0_XENBU|nr:hypothetical protein Xbud_03829 [Xenorhabdus budapestensis]
MRIGFFLAVGADIGGGQGNVIDQLFIIDTAGQRHFAVRGFQSLLSFLHSLLGFLHDRGITVFDPAIGFVLAVGADIGGSQGNVIDQLFIIDTAGQRHFAVRGFQGLLSCLHDRGITVFDPAIGFILAVGADIGGSQGNVIDQLFIIDTAG